MKKKKEASVPAKKKKNTNKRKAVALSRRVRELENEFSAIMKALQTETQPIIKNKPANTYVATVSFGTDRRLTQEEIDRLVFAVAVQIEDPSGADGEKRAEFSTHDVKAMIKRTRKINRRKK